VDVSRTAKTYTPRITSNRALFSREPICLLEQKEQTKLKKQKQQKNDANTVIDVPERKASYLS